MTVWLKIWISYGGAYFVGIRLWKTSNHVLCFAFSQGYSPFGLAKKKIDQSKFRIFELTSSTTFSRLNWQSRITVECLWPHVDCFLNRVHFWLNRLKPLGLGFTDEDFELLDNFFFNGDDSEEKRTAKQKRSDIYSYFM